MSLDDREKAQLRELLAREEINQVLNDFSRGVDELDFVAVGQCFAKNVKWDYGPGAGDPIVGREKLQRFVTESFSKSEVTENSMSKVRIKRTSHHVSNVRIDFDGPDNAHSEAYVFTWHEMTTNDRPGLVWGKWRDKWERNDEEGWRISERRMIVSATDNYYAIGYSAWDDEPLFKPEH